MNKWISVKHNLPDFEEPVLVCTDYGDKFVAWLTDVYSNNMAWNYSECCGCSVNSKVTHWMILPENPNE